MMLDKLNRPWELPTIRDHDGAIRLSLYAVVMNSAVVTYRQRVVASTRHVLSQQKQSFLGTSLAQYHLSIIARDASVEIADSTRASRVVCHPGGAPYYADRVLVTECPLIMPLNSR